MASRKINGHCYQLVIVSILLHLSIISNIHCIVTPVNETLPLPSSLSTRIVTSPTATPSTSSSSSSSTPSSTTTTITPIDNSASSAGVASPVFSDSMGRMMAASSFIQNIQNASSSTSQSSSSSSSSSLPSSSTGSSTSSDSNSTDSPFRPNSGPPLLGETLSPNGLSVSKSFVDIVKDYERYKMAKYSGPRSIQPSLIYSGDIRSVNNREQLLSPSTLQGYNNNNQQNGNNKLINGINGDAYAYSYLGQNGQITGPHPTSGSSPSQSSSSPPGPPGSEDYLAWAEDEVPYGLVKGYGESAVSPDSYFPTTALDYSSNYDFELLPQGSKTHSHEPVSSSQVVGRGASSAPSGSASYGSNSHHHRPSNSNPINSDLLSDSGFFNYHSLVSNMETNEELPILIESYVVNYPPLSEKPVAHSLSAFTFDHKPSLHSTSHHQPIHHHSHNPVESNHHGGYRHQSSLLASPSMIYPMIGPKPTSERVFISPYLYSRPCKYDCFATPLQDMKYGLMNFLEGAHNHGRR